MVWARWSGSTLWTAMSSNHDIVFGPEGTVAALVSHAGSDRVEDVVVEVDLESGAVTELADYTDLMPGYFDVISRPTAVTDDFFWLAGTHDWIHLNTLQYLEEQDSIIVSSRETSTIIKVEGIHTSPTLAWFAGDSRFWAGTPYEGLCLTQVGDFTPQYGQHSVEYAGPGPEEGTYYLRMYNNNYWSLNSRDGYAPDLEEGVGTGLYGSDGDLSYVYTYLIDENERTFSLEDSFPVPYSSIVSNAAPVGQAAIGLSTAACPMYSESTTRRAALSVSSPTPVRCRAIGPSSLRWRASGSQPDNKQQGQSRVSA